MVDIAVPGIIALFGPHFPTYEQAQFPAEVLCRYLPRLQLAEDAFLLEGIEQLTGVSQADLLKSPHGLFIAQSQNYAA